VVKKLEWHHDPDTDYWARKVGCVVDISSRERGPAKQYGEDQDALEYSPSKIRKSMEENRFLEALKRVVTWGNMSRTNDKIYKVGENTVESTLAQCHERIARELSIKSAWNLLVTDLHWSDTMTSKYLHFAVRSLEYDDPPVPIDNIMRTCAWGRFISRVT
jgi:hypothetical protein